LWLGPAPKVPFNLNRWGVHLIDPMHQCFDEVMPLTISAQGQQVLRGR
jgi:hypothetical protein